MATAARIVFSVLSVSAKSASSFVAGLSWREKNGKEMKLESERMREHQGIEFRI